MAEQKKVAVPENQEAESTKISGAVAEAFTLIAQLNTDQYSEFDEAFTAVQESIATLDGYMLTVTSLKLAFRAPVIVKDKEGVINKDESEVAYSKEVSSVLNLVLNLSMKDMEDLDEKIDDIRTLRKMEKILGVHIGDTYGTDSKNRPLGKVIDLRKGRKIIIQKFSYKDENGKPLEKPVLSNSRCFIVPQVVEDLEDEDE